MGTELTGRVIEALKQVGVQAAAAWPAGEMPELGQTAAAVSLFRVDGAVKQTVILIQVLCPRYLGASACEEAALTAWNAAAELGAVCTQEGCEYDIRTGLYGVKVYAAFQGADAWSGWAEPAAEKPVISVSLGSVKLTNAVSFTASQTLDETVSSSLSDMSWSFRLEETFGPADLEQSTPTEPFTITVERENGTDLYRECTWTSLRREVTPDGLRQIRTGTAQSRSFITIL